MNPNFKDGYYDGFRRFSAFVTDAAVMKPELLKDEHYVSGWWYGRRDKREIHDPNVYGAWCEFTQFKGDQQHWGAL